MLRRRHLVGAAMSGSLSRRLESLERRGDTPGQLADEIRRAVTLDEFLARELGQEPRPRHEIEAMVRAGKHRAKLPEAIWAQLNAHLGEEVNHVS